MMCPRDAEAATSACGVRASLGVVRRPGSIPMVGNHEREFSNRIFPEEWPSLFGFVGKSVVRKNGIEVPEVEAWDAWRPEEIADRQA